MLGFRIRTMSFQIYQCLKSSSLTKGQIHVCQFRKTYIYCKEVLFCQEDRPQMYSISRDIAQAKLHKLFLFLVVLNQTVYLHILVNRPIIQIISTRVYVRYRTGRYARDKYQFDFIIISFYNSEKFF